jgi:hypothetical protein
MNYPCIFLTTVPAIVVMVTDQIGTFHFDNQFFAVELNQVTNTFIDIDGPYDLETALRAARQTTQAIAESGITSADELVY